MIVRGSSDSTVVQVTGEGSLTCYVCRTPGGCLCIGNRRIACGECGFEWELPFYTTAQ